MGSSQAKYAQLDTLEQQLHDRLAEVLPTVASGKRTQFFIAPEFNPWDEIQPTEITVELAELANRILKLRHSLKEPVEESAAYLFIESCRTACNLDDHHRLGPKRLAEDLMVRLGISA